MRTNPVSSWFRPKRIGLGWSPASWEGWVVALGVTGLILSIAAGLA